MANLETKYLGLTLKNPLIVASSGLTKTPQKIEDCEKAGAGAVVIKSIFEEVLTQDASKIEQSIEAHPEAYDYLLSELELQYGFDEYVDLIKAAKDKVSIPVIASINLEKGEVVIDQEDIDLEKIRVAIDSAGYKVL
ncbi:MAG: hypothetical protein JEY94_15685 [Melioribacteraceae bacterium]|nr:hypothetical protein [Melioribacteraceae bacterium]